MNKELNYLLKIRFGKNKEVEGYFLDDEKSSKVDGKQAAIRIVETVPEDQINDMFEYLSDIVAELIAMSDEPDETSYIVSSKVRKYSEDFEAYKNAVGRFRLSKNLAKSLS